MNIRFYKTFSKRKNSTKQVGTATYSTHTCTLKQPTSMHDPVVQLATSEMLYTYAYIPDWSSYYFVQDVVSLHNGLVEYHLIEDVLATYKTSIGGTYARVAFSSSNYNVFYNDPRLCIENYVDQYVSAYNSSNIVFGTGSYILTTYSNSAWSSATGFAMSYQLNESAMAVIRQWFGDSSIMAALRNYFNGQPLESVFGCIWVPYTIPSGYLDTVTQRVFIGDRNNVSDGYTFPNGAVCNIIKGFPIDIRSAYTITKPVTPTDFRDFEPYSTAQIYLPGAGCVDVSLKDLGVSATVDIKMAVEIVTGNVRYIIQDPTGTIFQTVDCNVAAQCPYGQAVTNGGNILTNLGAAVGAGVAAISAAGSGGATAAVAAGAMIAGASNTALSAAKHGTSIAGSNGGRTASLNPQIYMMIYKGRTENPNDAQYIAERGRPCGKTVQISTLSGYVECEGASVSGSMTEHEREEINNFLNTGFYYE